MTDVYDRFDAATRSFRAWALLRDGKPVGRVVVKFGNAATAYVHLTGSQMATGRATGGGYDKESAAVRGAIAKLDPSIADEARGALIERLKVRNEGAGTGENWTTLVVDAGFQLAAVI